MWLVLKFPSYERTILYSFLAQSLTELGMILFFCAFLALKREDRSLPDSKLDNHILPEERHIFSW